MPPLRSTSFSCFVNNRKECTGGDGRSLVYWLTPSFGLLAVWSETCVVIHVVVVLLQYYTCVAYDVVSITDGPDMVVEHFKASTDGASDVDGLEVSGPAVPEDFARPERLRPEAAGDFGCPEQLGP